MSQLKEYQDNIPYFDDVALYNAAKVAVYIIVEKHGFKKDTIRNVARKYKVREEELKESVEIAIPKMFFAERAQKAKKRKEAAFYKPPAVKTVPAGERQSGLSKLASIKAMLKSSKPEMLEAEK